MQRFVRLPILVLGLAACLAHAQSTPKQIEEILGRHRDPFEAARELIVAANTGGGTDNITVVVVFAS